MADPLLILRFHCECGGDDTCSKCGGKTYVDQPAAQEEWCEALTLHQRRLLREQLDKLDAQDRAKPVHGKDGA